jgi:DNA-directed RNA polymerase I subunit RPA1
VKEVVTLFGAYGVSVDYRHLYLIGDYVTFGGNIKAMNRNWMKYNASPFLRMTFETSVKFITDSALRCETDKCKTPSSKIILGQPPLIGTGICDLFMDSNL